MQEVMDRLIELQDLDLTFDRLKKKIDEIPDQIEERSQKLDDLERKIEEKKEEAKQLQKKLDRKNLKLEELREEKAELKNKLLDADTNKQYAGIQEEIGHVETNEEQAEEQALELMERHEACEETINELERELEEEESKLESFREQCDERMEELEQKRDELAEEREEICDQIPNDILSDYENLHRNKSDGKALVHVNNGVCQGCFQNLTQQVQNKLYRRDDIYFCSNCSRILRFPNE